MGWDQPLHSPPSLIRQQRNPKHEICSPRFPIPILLFSVRTPTSVVGSLGAESGVEVARHRPAQFARRLVHLLHHVRACGCSTGVGHFEGPVPRRQPCGDHSAQRPRGIGPRTRCRPSTRPIPLLHCSGRFSEGNNVPKMDVHNFAGSSGKGTPVVRASDYSGLIEESPMLRSWNCAGRNNLLCRRPALTDAITEVRKRVNFNGEGYRSPHFVATCTKCALALSPWCSWSNWRVPCFADCMFRACLFRSSPLRNTERQKGG